MPPLNNAPLWRAFARRQINQAYADAGYRPDNGNATRLHGDPTIQARLAELQAEVTKETKLTVESLVNELEAARQKATDLKQLSAAVRAIEAKAKVSGLLVQKMEVGGPW
jgi:phage terminase small subunit